MTSPLDAPITVGEAAQLLRIGERHIQKLAKSRHITKPYTIRGVVQGWKLAREEGERAQQLNSQNNRATTARARIEELRASALEGEFITLEGALTIVDETLGPLKADMSGIPAQLTRDIPMRRRLETLLDGILERAAERAETAANALLPDGAVAASGKSHVTRRLGTGKPYLPGGVGRARKKRAKSDAVHAANGAVGRVG